jgi:hypothetical protein
VDPGTFFYIYYFLLQALFTFRNYYWLNANKYYLPHDTFNPLLSANRWDWQPHCKLGQSILVVLCAGSTLLLAPKIRSTQAPSTNTMVPLPKSASNNLQEWFLSPTGRLNLGIITEGRFNVYSSYLPLGVSQLVLWDKFFGAVAGEKEDFCKGSLSLPIFFTLLLFCLVFLLYFCLHLFIKNTKK